MIPNRLRCHAEWRTRTIFAGRPALLLHECRRLRWHLGRHTAHVEVLIVGRGPGADITVADQF